MLLQLIAAALTTNPLGAPSIVSISDSSSSGTQGRTAGVIFSSTGAFYKYLHGAPIEISKWLAPQTDMGDYEIRATLQSGDTPSGTFDTWEALDTTHAWELTTSTPEELLVATILIEIRWTGNDVVQDSATYTFTASGPAA